jgi:hypothetical protein
MIIKNGYVIIDNKLVKKDIEIKGNIINDIKKIHNLSFIKLPNVTIVNMT